MDINDYLMSPIPEIKDLAERAVNIQNLYSSNQITESEYTELANDLLELKHINKEMVDLEVTRELWQIINTLKNIKFFATLI
jgi:hypothetical protein